jgi:hypothetical protein
MNALRDRNNIPSKIAVLNTDTIQGQHLVRIKVTALGKIKTNTSDGISFTMEPIDARDDNFVTCWLFKGSDGLTYPAVANAGGELLISI